jgi:hypothetical protein
MKNATQHNDIQHNEQEHYAKCRLCWEFCIYIVMPINIMLSVIMLSVIMMNAVILSVVAPHLLLQNKQKLVFKCNANLIGVNSVLYYTYIIVLYSIIFIMES